MAIPAIILVGLNFLVYESPKFLLVKPKEVLFKELNLIAKANKKPVLDINLYEIIHFEKIVTAKKVYNYCDLFKYKSLRLITIASTAIMFCI